MKLLFLLLTIVFCFAFAGPKDHVSFKHLKTTDGQVYWEVDNSEQDTKEKIQQLLIPLVQTFIVVPEATYAFVESAHDFSFSFNSAITSEICSQGPPLV